MNRVSRLSRLIMIVFSVVLVSCTFLFEPFSSKYLPDGRKTLYEQYLSGNAAGADGLQTDGTSAKKMLSIPEIQQTPVSIMIDETAHRTYRLQW